MGVRERTMAQIEYENRYLYLSPEISSLVHIWHFFRLLAAEIGCKPNPRDILKAGGPRMLLRFFTVCPLPGSFRFTGPGAMPEAACAALNASEPSVELFHGAIYMLQN